MCRVKRSVKMSVCVCVCARVRARVLMKLYECVYSSMHPPRSTMHPGTEAYINAHRHRETERDRHTHVYIYIYIHVCVSRCICIYAYVHAYTFVYIYIYIHMCLKCEYHTYLCTYNGTLLCGPQLPDRQPSAQVMQGSGSCDTSLGFVWKYGFRSPYTWVPRLAHV